MPSFDTIDDAYEALDLIAERLDKTSTDSYGFRVTDRVCIVLSSNRGS